MDYLEAIDDYLEAETVVTSNWLANEMDVPLTKATDLLKSYLGTGKNVAKTYLYVGYDEEDHLNFQIKHESSQHQLKRILSQQIYAIQKTESLNLNTVLVHSMLRQSESLFLQDALAYDRESFVFNGLGEIKNSTITLRNNGERVFSDQNLQFKRTMSSNPSMSFKSMPSIPKAILTKPKESVPAASNTFVTQAATSFFKTASQTKPPTPPQQQSQPTVVKPNTAEPLKLNTATSGEKRKLEKKYQSSTNANDSEDEEWDVELENSPKKAKISEAPVVSSEPVVDNNKTEEAEESGSEEEDEENDENTPQDTTAASGDQKEKKPRKKRSSANKKKNIHIHGAMDNFMEDAAIEKFKQDQQEQAIASEQPSFGKKMKKVQVEKVNLLLFLTNIIYFCLTLFFSFSNFVVYSG
jgi:hypothetical protein